MPRARLLLALTRGLSAEFAPHGIRVVSLRPDGMPESDTIKEVFGLHAKAWGMSWELCVPKTSSGIDFGFGR